MTYHHVIPDAADGGMLIVLVNVLVISEENQPKMKVESRTVNDVVKTNDGFVVALGRCNVIAGWKTFVTFAALLL